MPRRQRKKYRATEKRFGGDVEKAFADIKESLASLIRKTKALNEYEELPFVLEGMFKHKIMYLYNPKITVPVFGSKELRRFEERLGLKPSSSFATSQRQLLSYKKSKYPRKTNYEFMRILYKRFGEGESKRYYSANDRYDDHLNDAISNRDDPTGSYTTKIVPKRSAVKGEDGFSHLSARPRDGATCIGPCQPFM